MCACVYSCVFNYYDYSSHNQITPLPGGFFLGSVAITLALFLPFHSCYTHVFFLVEFFLAPARTAWSFEFARPERRSLRSDMVNRLLQRLGSVIAAVAIVAPAFVGTVFVVGVVLRVLAQQPAHVGVQVV